MDRHKDNRYGHRARMRKQYIESGAAGMSDSTLLELYLGQIIPQKDVKPVVYDLLNKFGSLEGVFYASKDELTEISNIGDKTAEIIMLCGKMLFLNRAPAVAIQSTSDKTRLIASVCSDVECEAIIFILLSSNGKLCSKLVFENIVSFDSKIQAELLAKIFSTRATNCIIIHNALTDAKLTDDISLFTKANAVLRKIDVRLTDCIIYHNGKIKALSKTALAPMIN